MFESVAKYCQAYNDLIPVTFVLGFYVSLVVQRWWDQFTRIPWPDGLAMLIMASVQGVDERGRSVTSAHSLDHLFTLVYDSNV
jgi:hypothetical protein